MPLGNRSITTIARAVSDPRHYTTLREMHGVYPRFWENLGRYLFAKGSYPYRCEIRTPIGRVAPTLFSHHDMLTVNEVFCRGDYAAPRDVRVVVDIGSNIGISALYFLTRNQYSRCYLFEPVPTNVDRLRGNLRDFRERFVLHEDAVGDYEGQVEFGVEASGRYGGIGVEAERTIEVSCRHINDVLEQVLAVEETVDILKIDTEGMEARTIRAIDDRLLPRVSRIYLETPRETIEFHPLFEQKRRGPIQSLTLRP
jgi:FkbM family methyltransferase